MATAVAGDQMWGVGPAIELFGRCLGWAPNAVVGQRRLCSQLSPPTSQGGPSPKWEIQTAVERP